MAFETFSRLKQMVANRRGLTNDATDDTLRDNAILDAVKQIYQEAKFSWLKKLTTLTVTAGVADLPADFQVSYGLATVYDADKKEYTPVHQEEIPWLTDSDYRYWITWDATDKVFVFNTNQTTASLTAWYFIEPAEMSDGADTTPIPDPWAIAWLATALWWSAAEHEEDLTNNPFYPKYIERLNMMKAHDAANNSAPRAFRNKITDMPYNGPSISSVRR